MRKTALFLLAFEILISLWVLLFETDYQFESDSSDNIQSKIFFYYITRFLDFINIASSQKV
jgi:hypothetical protein